MTLQDERLFSYVKRDRGNVTLAFISSARLDVLGCELTNTMPEQDADLEVDYRDAMERFKMAVCLDGDLRGAPFYEDLVMSRLQPLLRRKAQPCGKPAHDLFDFLFGGVEVERYSQPHGGVCDACGLEDKRAARISALCGGKTIFVGEECTEVLLSALDALETLQSIRQQVNQFVEAQFIAFHEHMTAHNQDDESQ